MSCDSLPEAYLEARLAGARGRGQLGVGAAAPAGLRPAPKRPVQNLALGSALAGQPPRRAA